LKTDSANPAGFQKVSENSRAFSAKKPRISHIKKAKFNKL
jgi:hypothetical protein